MDVDITFIPPLPIPDDTNRTKNIPMIGGSLSWGCFFMIFGDTLQKDR